MITPRVRALLASTVRAACISVVIIGVTTAVDWVFNITPLQGVIADYPALKMNAAIGVTVAAWDSGCSKTRSTRAWRGRCVPQPSSLSA